MHNIWFYFLFSVQWLLRMLNYTLTESTFRNGLTKFLQERYALFCVFTESETNKHQFTFICTHYFTNPLNTLRTGDADLRLYITTVQDGWRNSAFLTRAWFPRTIHLITQYMEHFCEWSCWRMFIETRVFGEYFLKLSVHKIS